MCILHHRIPIIEYLPSPHSPSIISTFSFTVHDYLSFTSVNETISYIGDVADWAKWFGIMLSESVLQDTKHVGSISTKGGTKLKKNVSLKI